MSSQSDIGRKIEAGKCLPRIFLLPFSCQLFAVGLTVMGLLGSGFDGYGQDTGLAPEVTDLNAADVSYEREWQLPYLETPFITAAPEDRQDGIPVGVLGADGGNKDLVLEWAQELARPSNDPKSGNTDSLLISYQGKLIFESYFRRGRINYPHYQMSITKSYTAMALGRAIQLGYLTMDDLDKPVISFLKDLQPEKLVNGADGITLHQAMQMSSGIRLKKQTVDFLRQHPQRLKGQGQIQAYLGYSDPIPPAPRDFKYQASDPTITIQVLEAVVPGSAEEFIRDELWGRLGVRNYHWQADTSGLPKAAAGSSVCSRDMLKMGMLVLNRGKWQGQQLIPVAFVERATSPLKHSYGSSWYGYFWWVQDIEVDGKTYRCQEGRGAGGQFIFIFPKLDLIAVVTSHNRGMGRMLQELPQKLIPAFVAEYHIMNSRSGFGGKMGAGKCLDSIFLPSLRVFCRDAAELEQLRRLEAGSRPHHDGMGEADRTGQCPARTSAVDFHKAKLVDGVHRIINGC